jgi:hypothetical protein
MGEMIAFSIYNKPFKLLGIPRGRVKSREGLTTMISTNIFRTLLLTNMNFHTNTWFLRMSMLNKINTTITSSGHSKSIHSYLKI